MTARVGNPFGQRQIPKSYAEGTWATGKAKSAGVYVGIVKRNDDPQNMGRLQVYIKEFGGDPQVEASWITVSYASPFAGSTSIHDQGTNYAEYDDTIQAYGFWGVPPHLDAQVLVAFSAGKLDEGYWFACLYQRKTNVNVPGIPAKKTYDGENIPALSKNKRDPDPDLEKYVTHKPMYNALKRQGLEIDTLRGLTSSSSTREAPSKVLGILTPGQHQFVMDDGDESGKNKLIRLRTVNGSQVLIDDEYGHIYLITKNGENWVEMSVDGTIHVYGSNDISIHSQANINLRADKDVNIEAGNNINLKAISENINMQCGIDLNTLAGQNTRITSGTISHIRSVIQHKETAGRIDMNGPEAEEAPPIDLYDLVVNQEILESICNVVPEHEPWYGHIGGKDPKEDPAPDQIPRQAEDDEQGVPLSGNREKQEEVEVDQATASQEAQDAIKESNGYSPVNVDDQAGYGSDLVNLSDLNVP
jgi:hypothetical protein